MHLDLLAAKHGVYGKVGLPNSNPEYLKLAFTEKHNSSNNFSHILIKHVISHALGPFEDVNFPLAVSCPAVRGR